MDQPKPIKKATRRKAIFFFLYQLIRLQQLVLYMYAGK
ncbi:hypothetical protein SD78_3280 [Bacillus badius]|nr:hypothetical protein SD78_3280 [Bacillus badius]